MTEPVVVADDDDRSGSKEAATLLHDALVEAQLQPYLASIINLNSTRTTGWAPINSLPNETLQIIFTFLHDTYPQDSAHAIAFTPLHVCARWRAIALADQTLWSVVDLYQSRQHEVLGPLLNRSKAYSRITVKLGPMPPAHLVTEPLLSYMVRIGILSLSSPPWAILNKLRQDIDAPVLEQLSLEGVRTRYLDLCWAPNLRKLDLTSCEIQEFGGVFNGLKAVTFSEETSVTTVGALLGQIAELRELSFLSAELDVDIVDPLSFPPSLERVVFADSPDPLATLARHTSLGNVRTIEVIGPDHLPDPATLDAVVRPLGAVTRLLLGTASLCSWKFIASNAAGHTRDMQVDRDDGTRLPTLVRARWEEQALITRVTELRVSFALFGELVDACDGLRLSALQVLKVEDVTMPLDADEVPASLVCPTLKAFGIVATGVGASVGAPSVDAFVRRLVHLDWKLRLITLRGLRGIGLDGSAAVSIAEAVEYV